MGAQLSREETKKPINRFKLQMTILMYRKVLGIDWDDMVVAYISDEHPEYEGKTIPECAAEEGLSNLDMYLKLVDLSNGEIIELGEHVRNKNTQKPITGIDLDKNNVYEHTTKDGKKAIVYDWNLKDYMLDDPKYRFVLLVNATKAEIGRAHV